MPLNWSFENRVQTKEHRKGLFIYESVLWKTLLFTSVKTKLINFNRKLKFLLRKFQNIDY